MNEVLLKRANDIRRIADDLERQANAERPSGEVVALAAIKAMRLRAKAVSGRISNQGTKTGNGYKAALQDQERTLLREAEDLEKWLEDGIEPYWVSPEAYKRHLGEDG